VCGAELRWRLALSREGAGSGEDDDVDVRVLVEGGEGFGEFGEEVAGESVAMGQAVQVEVSTPEFGVF
jgi:hypothetical protein